MHIHLDAVGGIAGDMFLAACLDAWPEHEGGVRDAMGAAGLPADFRVDVSSARSKGLAGTRVAVTPPSVAHHHPTGDFRDIRRRLETSELTPPVRDRALDIFARLAEAEARAHGVSIDDVHFHEIADWDSVADIVGAAWLIDTLSATSWSISTLPTGSGTVETQHGHLPVPVPAVARLLNGYQLVDDGISGERVTPTGAAIVVHLEAVQRGPGTGVLQHTGHGLGTRELPDRPNMLRLLAFADNPDLSTADPPWADGAVTVISFDVDDQTPEDLAVGLDAIRLTEGTVDVVSASASGKKGRLTTTIRVLCHPGERDRVIRACFEQTTTIGLRWHDERRAELRRDGVSRDGVAGKTVRRPGGVLTTKPEIDAIADITDTAAERERVRTRFLTAEGDPS